jgi:Regulator of chromosome condensation (RCC1) repeat
LAVLKNGTVMAWGYNEKGELGDGTETNSDVPVAVCAVGEQAPCAQHLSGVTTIAAGAGHTLALLGNGTVVAWGASYRGLLGDGYQDVTPNGAIAGSNVPVAVDGLSQATTISAGGEFSLAIGTLAPLDLFHYGPPETETPTGEGGGQPEGPGTPPAPAVNTPSHPTPLTTPKPLTKAQKLAKALKQCEKHKNKTKRTACEKQAHKRYATTAKKTTNQKPRG